MQSRKWFLLFLVIALAWGFCSFDGVAIGEETKQGTTASSSPEVKKLLRQAASLELERKYEEAKQLYLKALEKEPRNAVALNNLGWLLATCPVDEIRNGREATIHAVRACVVTEWKNITAIQTLAVAFAEDGQMQKAIVVLVKLRSKVPAAKREEINRRLKLFRAGKTYRGVEPSPSKKPEPSSTGKPDLDKELAALLKSIWTLEKTGRLSDAAERYEKAIDRAKVVFGPEHVLIAQLMVRRGDKYLQTRQYDKARSLFEEALPRLRTHLAKDHKEVMQCASLLATSYYETKQYEKARSLSVENLDVCEKTFGKDHAGTLESLLNLAATRLALRQHEKALPLLNEWLKRNERGQGKRHPSLPRAFELLGQTHYEMGNSREAEKYLTRAFEAMKAQKSGDRLQEANILLGMARVLCVNAEPETFDKAEKYAARAVKIITEVCKKNDPRIATAKGTLAMVYRHFKKYAKAEPALQDALLAAENAFGKDHPATFVFRVELARVYLKTGRAGEAEKTCRPCIDIMESKYGGELDPQGAEGVLKLMVETVGRTGHRAEAETRLKRLIQSVEKRLGKENLLLAKVLVQAGDAYAELGDVAEAKACYKRCLDIRQAKLGPEHLDVAVALQRLGSSCLLAEQYAEAESLYDRCLPIFQKRLGEKHDLVADCLCDLGFLYMRTGRRDKAEETFGKAMRVAMMSSGNSAKEVLEMTFSRWGRLYRETKRPDKAEPFQKRALALAVDLHGREHPRVAWECVYLAQIYRATKRYSDAERLYRYAITLFEKTRGKNHPDLRTPLADLGNLLTELGRSDEADPLLKRSAALQKQDASK